MFGIGCYGSTQAGSGDGYSRYDHRGYVERDYFVAA